MKNNASTPNSWDDLVFENKNKNYGAYDVRKSYTQNATTGLGVSVAFACALLCLPVVMKMLGKDVTILPDPTVIIEGGMVFDPPPALPPPPTLPPPATQTAPPITNLPPEVTTTAPIENEPPTVAEINTAMNTEAGEGSMSTAAVTGTGTGTDVVVAPKEPEIFITAEVMPTYEGGLQELYRFVSRKIKYPASARRTGTMGTVYVSFVINRDGKVDDIKVISGISADCDKEAARVIALLDKWSPGQQNHHPVNVRMTLPIKFTIAD